METAPQDGGGAASDTTRVPKAKISPPVSQLVRLLWGEDTAELQMAIGHIPHIVMYLSLNLDSASSKEEVSGCRQWLQTVGGVLGGFTCLQQYSGPVCHSIMWTL